MLKIIKSKNITFALGKKKCKKIKEECELKTSKKFISAIQIPLNFSREIQTCNEINVIKNLLIQ